MGDFSAEVGGSALEHPCGFVLKLAQLSVSGFCSALLCPHLPWELACLRHLSRVRKGLLSSGSKDDPCKVTAWLNLVLWLQSFLGAV